MQYSDYLVEKILNMDPLAVAEEVTGKSYKDEPPEALMEEGSTLRLGFGLVQRKAQLTERAMRERADTFMGMSWEYFLDTIKSHGFEIVLERTFPYKHSDIDPTLLVAAHRQHCLILQATSWQGSKHISVNGGTCYGSVRPKPDRDDHDLWHAMNHCSHGGHDDGTHDFSKDIRDGLFFCLDRIAEAAEFVPWSAGRVFLRPNLLYYGPDHEITDHDMKAYSQLADQRWEEFLATAPDWVKEFVNA